MSASNASTRDGLTVAPFPSHRLNRWAETIWRIIGGVNVRTKILGMVLALTIMLGLAVTWQVRAVMTRVFADELENRGVSVASDLASRSIDPILLNDTYTLHELLRETVLNHPDALYAFVLNPQGEVLAHTFGDAGFPAALLNPEVVETAEYSLHGAIRHWVYNSNEGLVHEMIAPIMGGKAGVVRLGLTEKRLQAIVDAVTGQMLLTTLAVAMAGIIAAMILTWLLTRPILDLVKTTEAVGHGNLQARAPHWADDEIGTLADAFNRMVAELETSQRAIAEKEQARHMLLKKLITAQEEERKRIARELHDGVGQVLTSLMVGIRTLQRGEAAQQEARIDELCAIAGETLEQVRTLSRELRPSLLDDLGLAAALERYASEFARAHPGVQIDLHCALPNRLPTPIETALYRIVQEAMTNAARHGKATVISVLVSQRHGSVQAIVEDNGVGFDVDAVRRRQSSVGIFGMSERAELLSGTLEIESGSDGTTVYAEIPL
ncbi:HAMP domain-containing protein [Caldilinea sp.]|jgi:signal transduction histidine kinase|uniref:sensor histidine kinase n=1 Tax=Caldilinea sp. TaxID=2293560 RepID=UPI001B2D0E05|nr:HAMP domain-containing protein [Caldilinea sp.]MBO9391364.1 HAMP domain-containing protein [Caldilinea sp.]